MVALLGYLMWGVLPIYWKLLAHVPAIEILQHRFIWLLIAVVFLIRNRKRLLRVIGDLFKPVGRVYWLTSLILGGNWLIYIWAVNAGHIVETSLGYFINPLVNVVLGVVFFRESLRSMQWIAVFIAAIGVLYLTLALGEFPWISLTLAFSFAAYGLLRKTASREALDGLTMESAVLFIPGLIGILYAVGTGQGVLFSGDVQTLLLLPLTGLFTALPLLFFNYGARRIPFSLLGILQYVAPTLQFLIGVFLYHEPFSQVQVVGFSIIWFALILYTVEKFIVLRLAKQQ